MKNPYSALTSYLNSNKNLKGNCPVCHDRKTLQEYPEHAKKVHRVDPLKQCIFCKKYSFKKGTKTSRPVSAHILQCVKKFLETGRRKNDPRDSQMCFDKEESLKKTPCECMHFNTGRMRRKLGRRKKIIGNDAFYRDYHHPLKNPGSLLVFHEKSGLGTEASALIHMHLSKQWTFYHVYVRHYAFDMFQKEMTKLGDTLVVSPFWCLCDGTKKIAPSKLHRHMIVAVSDPKQFTEAWKRVKVDDPPGACKGHAKIKTPFHLAQALHYVSSPKSRCNGMNIGKVGNEVLKGGHFFLNRPLHKHSVLFMSLLWEGGLNEWVKQQLYSVSVHRWKCEEFYDDSNHKKYRVLLSEALNIQNCVFPLPADVRPCSEGRFKLYFMNGKTRCFQDGFPQWLFEKKSWHEGCMLCENIEGDYFVCNKTQTTQNNIIKYIMDKMSCERDEKLKEQRKFQRAMENRLNKVIQKQAKTNKQRVEKMKQLEEKIRELEEKIKEQAEKIKKLEEKPSNILINNNNNINNYNK